MWSFVMFADRNQHPAPNGYSQMNTSPSGAAFSGNSVFRKTQRGYAEIAQETQILHPRLRRFLVFVDGVRTLDQLVEMTQVLGSARDAVGELFRDGFIALATDAPQTTAPAAAASYQNVAPFPGNMVPPAAPAQPQYQPQPPQQQYVPQPQPGYAPQPAAPAPQQSRGPGYFPLEQIKAYMLSDLRARMKKDAELIAPKIMSAGSAEDLIVMMMRLRDILTKYSGPDDADQFVKKFKDMLI
jgi:hypothetical protein